MPLSLASPPHHHFLNSKGRSSTAFGLTSLFLRPFLRAFASWTFCFALLRFSLVSAFWSLPLWLVLFPLGSLALVGYPRPRGTGPDLLLQPNRRPATAKPEPSQEELPHNRAKKDRAAQVMRCTLSQNGYGAPCTLPAQ